VIIRVGTVGLFAVRNGSGLAVRPSHPPLVYELSNSPMLLLNGSEPFTAGNTEAEIGKRKILRDDIFTGV
jgi:hypothetical protein